MSFIERPDGARIHYQTWGSNNGATPLLLIAPGGVCPEIGFLHHSEIDPTRDLADERLVIGMDQRHAGESIEAFRRQPRRFRDRRWCRHRGARGTRAC